MDRRDFLKAGGVAVSGLALGLSVAEPAFADGAPMSRELGGELGVTDHDLDPRTSVLTAPADGDLLLDQDYRSVGLDLGRTVEVNAVRLGSDRPAHRLNARDLAVYTSSDGRHWTKQRSDFLDLGSSIWLYSFDVRARYVKVHCYREGDTAAATFGQVDSRQLITAYRVPTGAFVAGSGAWSHQIAITLTNPGGDVIEDQAAYISHQALGTSELIAAGMLRPDLADLRFADPNGRQLHAYDDGAGIFVRVPSVKAQGATPILAYLGNPEADSVLTDAAALQVEYGHRTFQPQVGKSEAGLTLSGEVHPFALPDGTLLMAGGTTAAGGIHARYSRDGGRTWSAPDPLIPPSDPSKGADRAGGFLVDPVTGGVTAVLYSVGVSSGDDWTDPTQHLCQLWVARATTYDAEGRPVFETPQHQPIMNYETGKPASWTITYTNPVRTRSGAYVVSVPHIFRPDGQFALAVLRSVDQGRTWSQSPGAITSPDGGVRLEAGVSESTVNQLPSGRLVIFARHQELTRYYYGISQSDDDGRTWSPLTDSQILASNTSPDLMARRSDLLLSWPGHNGFGQTSYYRNNLTIAYSTDGRQFAGYHDIAGATSLSTPGWKSSTEQQQMREAFIAPAGSDDLLLGWQNGGGSTGASILIEDVDDYLYKSHGALDVIRYLDTGGVGSGKELSQSRWWRTAAPGALTITDGIQAGRTALRLTTAVGEKGTGMSRLFPGSRRARVRFWLRWDALGSGGAYIALQEGFAATGNAHGAIALFQLGPDGTLRVASDDVYDAVLKGGYIEADTDPAIGNLGWSGGAVALDYNHRSIGLYLGAKREVSSLVLTGAAQYATGGTSTRLKPEDLGVWISDTNNSDWTQVTGWSGTKDGLTITLTGPTFTSSFVKITQPYGDKAFTYANTIPPLVTALPDPGQAQTFRPLQVPTQLNAQHWHQVEVDINLDTNRIVTAIDGNTVSTLGSVHPAQTMTHLLILAGDGGGADLRIAELLVQDTTNGLPQLGEISPAHHIAGAD